MPVSTCVFCKDLNLFKLTKNKGKSVSCSGYGVSHTSFIEDEVASTSVAEEKTGGNAMDEKKKVMARKKSVTCDYLFIEEALFLHERGLLEVYIEEDIDPKKEDDNARCIGKDLSMNDKKQLKIMSTRDLYDLMLNQLNMPIGVYLSYAHLRNQDYIVIRHTTRRRELIEEMNVLAKDVDQRKMEVGRKRKLDQIESSDNKESTKDEDCRKNIVASSEKEDKKSGKVSQVEDESPKLKLAKVKKLFRELSCNAPMPQIWNKDVETSISYDVYNPDSSYKKSQPGLPSFYVAITPFSLPSPSFAAMKAQIEYCKGIPLKVCTVADGGTINMFGMTDLKVPSINGTQVKQSSDV